VEKHNQNVASEQEITKSALELGNSQLTNEGVIYLEHNAKITYLDPNLATASSSKGKEFVHPIEGKNNPPSTLMHSDFESRKSNSSRRISLAS
jgi:hypothetical protein